MRWVVYCRKSADEGGLAATPRACGQTCCRAVLTLSDERGNGRAVLGTNATKNGRTTTFPESSLFLLSQTATPSGGLRDRFAGRNES